MSIENNTGVASQEKVIAANHANGLNTEVVSKRLVAITPDSEVLDEGNIVRVSDLYKNLRDPRMPIPQENRDRGHYLVRNRYR